MQAARKQESTTAMKEEPKGDPKKAASSSTALETHKEIEGPSKRKSKQPAGSNKRNRSVTVERQGVTAHGNTHEVTLQGSSVPEDVDTEEPLRAERIAAYRLKQARKGRGFTE